jgi:hypothetical protein
MQSRESINFRANVHFYHATGMIYLQKMHFNFELSDTVDFFFESERIISIWGDFWAVKNICIGRKSGKLT